LEDNWANIEGAFYYLFARRSEGGPLLTKRVAPFGPTANWLAENEWCTATPINAYHVGYFTTVGLLFTDKRHGARVGYFPDLRRLDAGGKAQLQGAEVLLIDSTQFEAAISEHLPIPEAMALCRELAVRQPILTHIGHLGWNTARLRAWLDANGFPHALIAHDGLVITVDAAGVHIAD
jgi:ribonuclease BN (tRNA processing enzyme)